jgi:putative colanic acid biosynthesis UDP-glucose lipid carrier transferase
MGNKEFQFLRAAMLLTDFILLNCAALIAILLKFSSTDAVPLFAILIAINASWLIIAYFLKLYTYSSISYSENTYRQSWRVWLLQSVLLYAVFYFASSLFVVNHVILNYACISGILIFISRFFQTFLVEYVFRKINVLKVSQKIAIVGYDDKAQKLAEYFQRNKNIYNFFGFFADSNKTKNNSEGSLFPLRECMNYVVKHNVKEIYSTVLPHENPQVSELVREAEANFVRLRFVSNTLAGRTQDYNLVAIDELNQMTIMALRNEPLHGYFNRIKKRGFDLIVSSLIIIFIMSWLTPLLGIIIKLTSKGPVFFIQDRSGKDNKSFRCMKFRSMHVNGESDERQAGKDDPRITPIGAFMRKTSLDEFPQFFNVFKGEMSICGPRPHMLKHTEEYSQLISRYMIRHYLKPGVTGWAQVSGYRGETEDPLLMEKRVEHDIWYMENWSLMLDIRIIFMTIFNIFKGEEKAR